MARARYAISVGHDVANPTNVEFILPYPPRTRPDNLCPLLGPIERITSNGNVQFNGAIRHRWTFDGIRDLNTDVIDNYITTIFTNYTTGSVDVSIVTLTVARIGNNNRYARFNARAINPMAKPGEDFISKKGGGVAPLIQRFTHLTFITFI